MWKRKVRKGDLDFHVYKSDCYCNNIFIIKYEYMYILHEIIVCSNKRINFS